MRSYHQYCPLAYALDVVGDRWSLLVVRDLGLGPRRFTDLQRGLPRLSPGLLATRLRALSAAGVVAKRELPPPSAVTVYELTDSGRELHRALRPLVQWGARYLPPRVPDAAPACETAPAPDEAGDYVGAVPAMTALTLLHRTAEGARPLRLLLRAPPEVFTLVSASEGLSVSQSEAANADIEVTADQASFLQVVLHQRRLERAEADGAVVVHHGEALVAAFLERFGTPDAWRANDAAD